MQFLYMEVFGEFVSSNKQAYNELKNKNTFIIAAYFGSQTPFLFQLLPLLLLFLFWGEVLLCRYLQRDEGHMNCDTASSTKIITYNFAFR